MYTRKIGYGGKTLSFGGANVNVDINAPNVVYDSSTFMWFIANDSLEYMTAESNLLSVWNDLSQQNNNLIQNTASKQPLYNSTHYVKFYRDWADSMQTEIFDASIYQPISIYMVIRQDQWHDAWRIFEGQNQVNNVGLMGWETEPQLFLHAGGGSIVFDDLKTDNLFHIMRILLNGSNSKIQIDSLSAVIGDIGTNPIDRLTLCSIPALNDYFGKYSFKEILFRNCIDSSENEQEIYNYLKYKYNIDMDKLYGRELVYNGTFDTSAKWATSSGALPSAGWSIVDNKLYCDGTNYTACAPLADDNQNFLVLMPGAKYIMECDVSATGTCTFFGPNTGDVFLDNGHNSIIFTYGPSFNNWFEGWDSFVGSIDNVSVRQYFG